MDEHFPEQLKELKKSFIIGNKKIVVVKQGEPILILARVESDRFESMKGYVMYHVETAESYAVGHSLIQVIGDESGLPVISHE